MPIGYLFEVRSIQSYLFAGGKLRDMMAASDMVDRLCGEVFKCRPGRTGYGRRGAEA
jgi:hypothetical protein